MKKYDQVTPIKITVEGGLCPDRSLQLTLHPYATLEEWIGTFKVMLLHQTFSEDTIKELFDPQIDYADDSAVNYEESCYDTNKDAECDVDENITYRSFKQTNWKQEF